MAGGGRGGGAMAGGVRGAGAGAMAGGVRGDEVRGAEGSVGGAMAGGGKGGGVMAGGEWGLAAPLRSPQSTFRAGSCTARRVICRRLPAPPAPLRPPWPRQSGRTGGPQGWSLGQG